MIPFLFKFKIEKSIIENWFKSETRKKELLRFSMQADTNSIGSEHFVIRPIELGMFEKKRAEFLLINRELISL